MVLDADTTGLHSEACVVELAERFRLGGRPCEAGRSIPEGASQIHGITDERAASDHSFG